MQSIISCRKYPRSLSRVRDLISFVEKSLLKTTLLPEKVLESQDFDYNKGGAVPMIINLRLGIAW